MDGNETSFDHIIAELIEMGFELNQVKEAIQAVGPSLNDALEFILNGSNKTNMTGTGACSTSQTLCLGKGSASLHSRCKMKQAIIADHFPSLGGTMKRSSRSDNDATLLGAKRSKSKNHDEKTSSCFPLNLEQEPGSEFPHVLETHIDMNKLSQENGNLQTRMISELYCYENEEVESDWKNKIAHILQKHYGFSSLKGFQFEALEAWSANRDCLVLAATGSGKSLCFQLPALLTRKIVVVVSPLISLMRDQCLKLSKHGISACFLGSGQPDSTVEYKAMSGMYKIVYVCPETISRLIEPLKRLAENPGIALFAIDEVHCVSKWGHDFRPDYRRLSLLRENFNSGNLKFLKFDIPLMALTATATIPVREDIIHSLHMTKELKIILTSFFRPNLRFSVKNSRTSRSSYDKDFSELIKIYTTAKTKFTNVSNYSLENVHEDNILPKHFDDVISDEEASSSDDENELDCDVRSYGNYTASTSKKDQLTVEYLEDEVDIPNNVDDLDVSCGEFPGISQTKSTDFCGVSETSILQESLEQGPTIIYVPTRKETVQIAQHLCKYGVKASAYHAKMPKTHLRHVHEEFHKSSVEVVVATIAFGMGIDKPNVRRVIHYGWPQSLEAYYQEAGRAGRDGKLSDCTLYANLSRVPTLLPSQRTEEHTRVAYRMLSDCFCYAMNTATCRTKILVGYFGEELASQKCNLCDICVSGPPKIENLKEQADIFMQVLKEEAGFSRGRNVSDTYNHRHKDKPSFKMVVSRIREQFQKFAASEQLWWQGLARILESMGFIKEGDNLRRVLIRFPELTDSGLRFMDTEAEKPLYAYLEADMLISMQKRKPFSTFSEWGRGWADPEIRRQRLQGHKSRSRKRRKSKKNQNDLRTVRGRLAAKLSKHT